MSPQASVIIVNWNGRAYLDECLRALQEQDYPDFEVVLVDNGSTDGSAEWVAKHHPWVRLIRLPCNVGFAAGNNVGIRATQSQYVVTLNNDTRVEQGWLTALVTAAETDPRVGMCASLMLYAHTPGVIDSAGIAVDWTGTAWPRCWGEQAWPSPPGPLSRSPSATASSNGRGEKPQEVFGPCAGAALYRRAMLEDVGLFDEDFFAYYEDVDLAWRGRLQGWRCLYVPTAKVYHVHSATGEVGSAFKAYYLSRNRLWTILKNYPAPWLWLFWSLVLVYDGLSLLEAIRRGQGRAALRGRRDAWRWWREMWARRKRIQARRSPEFRFWEQVERPRLRRWLQRRLSW